MSKKIKLLLIAVIFSFSSMAIFASPSQTDYPHWDFKNKTMVKKLETIDNFINANKNKGYVAIFDWDGTLYNEEIPLKQFCPRSKRAGQPAWFVWSSYHLNDPKYPGLFPMMKTKDGKGQQNLLQKEEYQEFQLNIKPNSYDKFTQAATLLAGMTPETTDQSVEGYLNMYPVNHNIFYPTMDVLQRMINSGFHVYIVTGSNPYYLSVVLNNIEKHVKYRANQNYHFNLGSVPYHPDTGHIVGNLAKLTVQNTFANVYDNRYVKNNSNHHLYIVDEEGKAVAIKTYIEKREKMPAIFYAGNSGGDTAAVNYILGKKQSNTLVIAINPRGTLTDMIKKYPEKIVVMNVKY